MNKKYFKFNFLFCKFYFVPYKNISIFFKYAYRARFLLP
jgi:hypothetical protein